MHRRAAALPRERQVSTASAAQGNIVSADPSRTDNVDASPPREGPPFHRHISSISFNWTRALPLKTFPFTVKSKRRWHVSGRPLKILHPRQLHLVGQGFQQPDGSSGRRAHLHRLEPLKSQPMRLRFLSDAEAATAV